MRARKEAMLILERKNRTGCRLLPVPNDIGDGFEVELRAAQMGSLPSGKDTQMLWD